MKIDPRVGPADAIERVTFHGEVPAVEDGADAEQIVNDRVRSRT
jgi:hypothetical protein